MTRINCIPVEWLTDQHAFAECREAPRVFALARPLTTREAVTSYRLGRGHVLFFYHRTGWLSRRCADLIADCLGRGYNLTHREPPAPVPDLDNDWSPTTADMLVNLLRLDERLQARPGFYKYHGVAVPDDFYTRRIHQLIEPTNPFNESRR